MINRRSGFTLIELVMVIVILGILAVEAVPRFIDLRISARESARDGVVAGVKAGIAIAHAAWLTNRTEDLPAPLNDRTNTSAWNTSSGYPIVLDAATGAQDASQSPFFVYILEQGGITTSDWAKGGSTTVYNYIDSSNSYTYTNSNGSFQ